MATEDDRGTMVQQTGVVAMLDILGVKGLLARTNAIDFVHAWSLVTRQIREAIDKVAVVYTLDPDACLVAAFSDTIIIVVPAKNATEILLAVGAAIAEPFCVALRNRIYLRGAIAVGPFHRAETTVIGQALDEAAAWYETMDWIGVCATPTAGMILDELAIGEGDRDRVDPFRRMSIPFKAPDMRRHDWALAWADILIDEFEDHAEIVLLQSLATPPIEVATAPKYRSTLQFFRDTRDARRD